MKIVLYVRLKNPFCANRRDFLFKIGRGFNSIWLDGPSPHHQEYKNKRTGKDMMHIIDETKPKTIIPILSPSEHKKTIFLFNYIPSKTQARN